MTARAKVSTNGRPKYSNMILEALLNLANRNGSSRIAIYKYIDANYNMVNEDIAKKRISMELKKGVESGLFLQNKQSFRISTSRRQTVKNKMIGVKTTKSSTTKTGNNKTSKTTTNKTTKSTNNKTSKTTTNKTTKSGNNKTTKTTKASNSKRVTRPIKEWIIEILESHGRLSEYDILKLLIDQKKIPKVDQTMFERSLKAIITRGITDNIWSAQDKREWITLVNSEDSE